MEAVTFAFRVGWFDENACEIYGVEFGGASGSRKWSETTFRCDMNVPAEHSSIFIMPRWRFRRVGFAC